MEIPDSDEEEEILLPPINPQNNHQHGGQEQEHPKEQKQPISITHFIGRILTQLNIITTQHQQHNQQDRPEQHEQEQEKGHGQGYGQKNPLSSLSSPALSQVKPLMLTLHCLFPNELLPALDILDRGLIRRLVLQGKGDERHEHEYEHEHEGNHEMGYDRESSSPVTNMNKSPSKEEKEQEAVFFVMSTSNTSIAMAGITEYEKKGYEVRLQAWNCTCTPFLLSAFPDADFTPHPDPGVNNNLPEGHYEAYSTGKSEWERYQFGGTLTRGLDKSPSPVCKHLLACMLLVRCPRLFGKESQTGPCRRLVSVEELAAWCAGWGDS